MSHAMGIGYAVLPSTGPTSFLLGIHITRDFEKRTISLSQCQYIVDMLDCFGFGTCSPVSTPMDPGLRLTPEMGATSDEDKAFMLTIPYLSAVGALMYLGLTSRPDISNAVGILSRFSANPGPAHWKAVKHHIFQLVKCQQMHSPNHFLDRRLWQEEK